MDGERILINKNTGVAGVFKCVFTNRYGEIIIVKTYSGREYFAPTHEWHELTGKDFSQLKNINKMELFLGKQAKDKITGFEGIVVTKLISLFGCNQYGIASQVFDKEKGKRGETEYFDEGRLEITGIGILPSEVQVEEPGAESNYDAPRS